MTAFQMGRTTASVGTFALAVMVAGCGGEPGDYRPTAATAPSTDIFLAELTLTDEGVRLQNVANVTDRDGYDNQPQFLADGSALLYTSGRDTVQTDIYRYDLSGGTSERLTRTDDASEYSATLTPDGLGFSTIRERAGLQHLWRFRADGSEIGVILPDLEPVGYHAWADENTIVAFVLGDSVNPATLQVADLRSGESTVVVENPGRSLHRIPGRDAISFVHKVSDDVWLIKAIEVRTREVSTLTPTLPGREDYAWLPDGSILMGEDSALYRWWAGGAWEMVQDLQSFGVSGISRIAVSPNGRRIAIVGTRPAD